MAFCLPLAFVLAALSSRSTVDCISMLVLGPSSVMASARSSEAGAVDRKPKPTRQQDRESISWPSDLKATDQAAPDPDALPFVQEVFGRATSRSAHRDTSSGFIQATRPDYLKPGSSVALGQRPPPTSPVA